MLLILCLFSYCVYLIIKLFRLPILGLRFGYRLGVNRFEAWQGIYTPRLVYSLLSGRELARTVNVIPGEESVKRFERSNGLDTALYKTIPLPCASYLMLVVYLGYYLLSSTIYYTSHVGLRCDNTYLVYRDSLRVVSRLQYT